MVAQNFFVGGRLGTSFWSSRKAPVTNSKSLRMTSFDKEVYIRYQTPKVLSFELSFNRYRYDIDSLYQGVIPPVDCGLTSTETVQQNNTFEAYEYTFAVYRRLPMKKIKQLRHYIGISASYVDLVANYNINWRSIGTNDIQTSSFSKKELALFLYGINYRANYFLSTHFYIDLQLSIRSDLSMTFEQYPAYPLSTKLSTLAGIGYKF